MSLTNSGEIAASGMSVQRRRLEVIASNLANARTTRTAGGGPYRKKMVIFNAVELASTNGSFDSQLRRYLRGVEVSEIVEDKSPFLREFDPGHPDADSEGYVSFPNVNAVDEMVNMISAARSYEANLQSMRTLGKMKAAALELAKA